MGRNTERRIRSRCVNRHIHKQDMYLVNSPDGSSKWVNYYYRAVYHAQDMARDIPGLTTLSHMGVVLNTYIAE